MPKLKVSISTYNEIAGLLEANGIKLGENHKEITLEKNIELLSPIDYRLVTIRRDIADIAAKSYQLTMTVTFVEYTNELFNFVLKGEIPQKQTNILTIEKSNPNWK